MAEFIIRNYREGIGKSIACQTSNLHKDKCEKYQKKATSSATILEQGKNEYQKEFYRTF